jgi:hypothetical protein
VTGSTRALKKYGQLADNETIQISRQTATPTGRLR